MKAIYMMAIVFSPIICRVPGKRQIIEGNQKRFCKQAKSYFCVFFEHGAGTVRRSKNTFLPDRHAMPTAQFPICQFGVFRVFSILCARRAFTISLLNADYHRPVYASVLKSVPFAKLQSVTPRDIEIPPGEHQAQSQLREIRAETGCISLAT